MTVGGSGGAPRAATPPASRAPVLFPAPTRRPGDSEQRVMLRDDGALVHRRSASDRVLIEPGDFKGAMLLREPVRIGRVRLHPKHGEWLLLLGPDRSIALPVPAWTPGEPVPHPDALGFSGVRALVAALGHPHPETFDLDEPDLEALAGAGRPWVIDSRPPAWRRRPDDLPLQAMRAIILLLIVLWIGEGLTHGPGDETQTRHPESVLVVLAILVALPLVSLLLGPWIPARRPRGRAGEGTLTPEAWVGPGGSPRIEVRDGGDSLLVVDATGTEIALPGPGLGGVVEISLLAADQSRPTSTRMLDAQAYPLMTLPASLWPSDDDAIRAVTVLRGAGLRISTLRVPRAAVQPLPSRRRLEPSFALDQVVFMTLCFGAFLCVESWFSRATVATGISALTVALAAGVGWFERRRSRP